MRGRREKEKFYVLFLLPGYKGGKKELGFQSYLTLSNKLKCAYWPAGIKTGFAPLIVDFWPVQQRKKREQRTNLCKKNLYFVFVFLIWVYHCAWKWSELLLQINANSSSKNNPIFPLPASRWSPLARRSHSCMKCWFFLSFCRAQGRKELITYFERFRSYYRTTPTAHLLSCAFICLLLY